MVAVRAILLLILYSAGVSSALSVYHCKEDGTAWNPRVLLRNPCTLSCCGRTVGLRPFTTFFVDNHTPLLEAIPNFSPPRCQFNSTTGFFLCSTTSGQHCTRKNYTCEVEQGNSVVTSVVIRAWPRPGEAPILPPSCLPPLITNISVAKRPGGEVLVTWNYTQDRGIRYCAGTRRFQVSFKSYQSYNVAERDYVLLSWSRGYVNVSRRETEKIFSNVNPNLFYRFFVRAKNAPKRRGEFTDPKYTNVKHFGPFVPLSWHGNLRKIYHVKEREAIRISCSANGVPAPSVTYWKRESSHERTELRFSSVHIGDNGTYICKACHEVFYNSEGRFRTKCQHTIIELVVIPKQNDRDCVQYTGTQCSEYIHRDWEVFAPNISQDLEQHISQFLSLYNSDNFSKSCQLFVKSVLCHSLLPYCNPFTVDKGRYSPLPICPKTCANLEARCGREIRERGAEFAGFLGGKCDAEARTGGPGDPPGCIFINPDHPMRGGHDTDLVPSDIAALECTLQRGRSYRGRVKLTASGQGCQQWSSQYPNAHQFTKMMVGELEGAGRYCRNPGGLGKGPWCFINSFNRRWEYCYIPSCEKCVPYSGEFCQPVGYSNSTVVFLRRQEKDSVADMELELLGSLHKVPGELTPGCELLARQLLCMGALPTCRNSERPLVCENQCHLLDMLQVCPPALQEAVLSISYVDFSTCTNQTLIVPSSDPHCLPDSDPVVPTVRQSQNHSEGCHNHTDLGQTYSGEESMTQKGVRCLPWSQAPSSRGLTKAFPELRGSFCRNPGQLGQRPWCFTSPGGDWDYCDVSLCSDQITGGVKGSSSRPGGASLIGIVSLLTGLFLGTIIAIGILVVVCQVRGNRKREAENRRKPPGVTNSMYSSNLALSPKVLQMTQFFRKIQKSKIRYVREIGQGNFGTVFLGECDWIKRNNSEDEVGGETLKVAVKTHKNDCSAAVVDEFVREARILHQFNHPHIVEFYGVCMEELPFYMVFEYMEQGDLCEFLRTHSSSSQRRYNPPISGRRRISSSVSNDSATLGTTDLLDICKQIASGMAYLESEKHIHRDLAARNCLVSNGLIIKIADFGMSQNLYSKDYYRVSGEASLPVRWMPPEAIVYGTFSAKGDVWAFGVVVWEVFSFGLQPYWGHTNEAVIDMVRKGKLLEKPDNCPDKLFALVRDSCWGMDEVDRFSFKLLDEELHNFRLSDSDSLTLSMEEVGLDDVFGDIIGLGMDDDDRD